MSVPRAAYSLQCAVSLRASPFSTSQQVSLALAHCFSLSLAANTQTLHARDSVSKFAPTVNWLRMQFLCMRWAIFSGVFHPSGLLLWCLELLFYRHQCALKGGKCELVKVSRLSHWFPFDSLFFRLIYCVSNGVEIVVNRRLSKKLTNFHKIMFNCPIEINRARKLGHC